MSCECYPPSRYPPSLAKGCNGPSVCWVMKDLKLSQTDEGRSELRARYYAKLSEAMNGNGQAVVDITHKLTTFGVPSNAIAVARRPEPYGAYESAKKWWNGDRQLVPSLVLCGPVQSGKTVASAWVAMQWAGQWGWNTGPGGGRQDDPLVWLDGRKLSRVGSFADQMADLMDNAARCSLLVVDDIGREGNRPAVEALSDVLKDRLDRNRHTILSTNLLPDKLGERYGDAMAERWSKRAMVVVCAKLKGKS